MDDPAVRHGADVNFLADKGIHPSHWICQAGGVAVFRARLSASHTPRALMSVVGSPMDMCF